MSQENICDSHNGFILDYSWESDTKPSIGFIFTNMSFQKFQVVYFLKAWSPRLMIALCHHGGNMSGRLFPSLPLLLERYPLQLCAVVLL